MVQKKGIVSNMGKGAIYLIVFLLGVICLLPLLNIVAVSFSGSAAVAANRVGIFPVDFTVAAYEKILGDHQFWRSFGISVARVVLALLLNLILIMLMAYPLSKSKREFKGRNIYMDLLIFAMLFNGGMIPTYIVIKNLGLLNTIWALILPGAVPIFSVIMVMNFFMGVPKALEEAAVIDGATPLQVLTKVYLPCSKPVIATIALFSIVGSWNDFFSGLLYMTKVNNYPLQTYIQSLNVKLEDMLNAGGSISSLVNIMDVSAQNLNAAKIVVSVIPLLLIYPLLQKYLITGIVVGSVKE
ncbi:MAG: carbohydrate ABC transporter permease [Lachnospiraceae bacterium]|jgi:putative aldouronate transport system permease protein|uniref:carbohydrate ABC transporter permease n=1 Tax=Mediterraneibacter gnavus TaxID=33038 RepID=UPI00156E635C|nr:carbohydrate ABC transporter permease [Mediterraneibacter gnavus]MDU6436750.1 carbohydrate ABC transporter permease [Lachnospiraceae bacterium]NSD10461.1 carbohydrate ABC transporter permease [Mediterraneibacter gnavus]